MSSLTAVSAWPIASCSSRDRAARDLNVDQSCGKPFEIASNPPFLEPLLLDLLLQMAHMARGQNGGGKRTDQRKATDQEQPLAHGQVHCGGFRLLLAGAQWPASTQADRRSATRRPAWDDSLAQEEIRLMDVARRR